MNLDDRNICAFAVDAVTEQALQEALAGHKEGSVHRGDIVAAIKHLTGSSSPHVVIVDLDGTRFPAGGIQELAGVCEFGTRVIAVGSNDTARLARELLATGVEDYFPKPVTAREIREAVRLALDGEDASPRLYAGRVVAFAGCGGGSGATTLAAVTVRAAAARGSYVSALDLGRTFGALPWMLDVEPPAGLDELFIHVPGDDSAGADMLDALAAAAGARVSVYGYRSGEGTPPVPAANAVLWLIEHLANRSHLVVVDGMSDADTLLPVLQNADERVLVYEPTLVSLNQVTHTLVLLGEVESVVLVENHTRLQKRTLSRKQVSEALAGREPDFTLPFEPKLPVATNRGMIDEALGKNFRQAVGGLVESLTRPTVSLAGAKAPDPE